MTGTSPTDTEVAAWARLVRVAQALLSSIEADLKQAGLPPLAWYDVLLELRRAEPEGLRPGALQQAMLLEQYNLSRLLGRMESAGLVRRRPHAEDRRGQTVELTEEGRAVLRRIWPVYRRAIAQRFAARLEPGEAETLLGLLGRLA